MKLENLKKAILFENELRCLKEDLEKYEKAPKKSVRITALDETCMYNYISVVVDSDELHKIVHNAIKDKIAGIEKNLKDLGVEI